MEITDVSSQYPLFLPPPKTPRTVGTHASGLIRGIATEAGILKPQWAEELSLIDVRVISDPVAILRISIGLAWEQFYIPEILSVYGVTDHPGELEYDGVYMTPDAEDLAVIITLPEFNNIRNPPRHILRIHEVKATYKSTKTVGNTVEELSKQWMWMAQIKAYCIAQATRFAVLHVLFLCGDYKFPITPQLKVWEIEFTQEELDSNWDLLSEYKREKLVQEVYRIGE